MALWVLFNDFKFQIDKIEQVFEPGSRMQAQ